MNIHKRLGFIGLGIMGSGMVANLLKHDFSVTVWNRNKDKVAAAVELGASSAASPVELSANCEILLLCVTDAEAVESVLLSDNQGAFSTGEAKCKIIIDLSTISPTSAITIGNKLLSQDRIYFDAPVSGGDVGAKNGTLTAMLGGPESHLPEVKNILEAFCKSIVYTGKLGNGQKTKCINQTIVAGTIAAMTEGLYLAEQSGLDLQTTLDAVSGGAAGSWALENYAPRLLKEDYGPGFYARDMLKDLNFVKDLAAEKKLDLPVNELVSDLYSRLLSLPEGNNYGNQSLIKCYRRP